MPGFLVSILTNQFVAFIIVIGIVVLVHEFGHFLAARIFGVLVEEFSIGFGPKAYSFKKGETEYRIGWLPLGGYVRLFGADFTQPIPQELKHRAIINAKVWQRMIISFAGPLANGILTFIFMIVISLVGIEKMSTSFSVMPNSIAATSGLKDGDTIKKINGMEVSTWDKLTEYISSNPGSQLTLQVERDNKELEITIKPNAVEDESLYGEKVRVGRIGITPYFLSTAVAVANDSPFSAAGLKSGDKIETVNGRPVKFFFELENSLASYLTELAKGQNRNLSLTIARMKVLEPQIPGKTASQYGKDISLEIPYESFVSAIKSGVIPAQISKGYELGLFSADLMISKTQKESLKEAQQDTQKVWEKCGIMEGDTFLKLDSSDILRSRLQITEWLLKTEKQVAQAVKQNASPQIVAHMEVLRLNGTRQKLSCEVSLRLGRDRLNRERYFLDFPFNFYSDSLTSDPVLVKSKDLFAATKDGFVATVDLGKDILSTVFKLIVGKIPFSNLGGPGEILRVAGTAAKIGFLPFFYMIAFISINVGLLNLLPIPVLDGGTLLLLAVEAIYGKPLPIKVQESVQKFGIIFMLILFVLVIYNDILRWISQ